MMQINFLRCPTVRGVETEGDFQWFVVKDGAGKRRYVPVWSVADLLLGRVYLPWLGGGRSALRPGFFETKETT